MTGYSDHIIFKMLPILVLGLAGCITTKPNMAELPTQEESEISEGMENLRRAVEASYDRERAMAERLRALEEGRARLLEEMEMLREEFVLMRRQTDGGDSEIWEPAPLNAPVLHRQPFDVLQIYQTAMNSYRNRRFDEALGQYGQILDMAPDSEWADNAQYWIGECYYGLGKYELSLTEFTKVFTYAKTTKADHAQLKIARCHMNLGQREKALMAFQKLLDEYPESDKLDVALKEMEYLGGP